jgi:ABC-type nitrate/sulfonate/bicarbonate transport system permease component
VTATPAGETGIGASAARDSIEPGRQPPARLSRLMAIRPLLAQAGPPALLLAAILGAWEWGVRTFSVPFYILPAPSRILKLLVAERQLLVGEAAVTLLEIALGFGIAFVVGIGLALLIFSSRTVERAVYPLVIASQTVPVFALAPLLIVWLGYGMLSKVAMAALIVFFPIVVNTVDGLKSVDPELLNLLRTLGSSRWRQFRVAQLPASLPFVFSGLKVAAVFSVIGAVFAEWVGASNGLGYLILTYNNQLETTAMFATVVSLSLIGIVLFFLVAGRERIALPWYHEARRGEHIGGEAPRAGQNVRKP